MATRRLMTPAEHARLLRKEIIFLTVILTVLVVSLVFLTLTGQHAFCWCDVVLPSVTLLNAISAVVAYFRLMSIAENAK